jgi:glycolate oxidase FAD binding subunit
VSTFPDDCPAALRDQCELREADGSHAVDGIQPRFVADPPSAQALAELLAAASRQGASTVISGGGTKLGWGLRPKPIDVLIRTWRLNRVLVHAHGDLTATVEAGTPVRDFNEVLARHGQWLPVDLAFDAATIGGMIATNEAGPLRHRHGTPRDLLIGVHLATTDGRIVKAGGTVVKNVAGYDLGKLMAGSHGSLAAIVSATFKLAPLPAASATVVMSCHGAEDLGAMVAAASASQLEPSSFDLHATAGSRRGSSVSPIAARTASSAPFRLCLRFTSTPDAVEAQVQDVQRSRLADSIEVVTGLAESEIWRGLTRGVWEHPGTIVRASWLPANTGRLVSFAAELAREVNAGIEIVARAAVGTGFFCIDAEADATVQTVKRMRARGDVLGHVVVLRAETRIKEQVDVWGARGDHEALLRSIKAAFDPAGVLNAGRGPV